VPCASAAVVPSCMSRCRPQMALYRQMCSHLGAESLALAERKSVRHGHILLLHAWACKPGSVCRRALCARNVGGRCLVASCMLDSFHAHRRKRRAHAPGSISTNHWRCCSSLKAYFDAFSRLPCPRLRVEPDCHVVSNSPGRQASSRRM
jgi:hypothetical protein